MTEVQRFGLALMLNGMWATIMEPDWIVFKIISLVLMITGCYLFIKKPK